jgi:hypothetical protein
MGQYLRSQTHGNPFHSHSQEQRELGRKCYRLTVSSIIGRLPLRCLCIEEHIEGKLGETRFDISGCCSIITSENITPVTLGVNEQILLSELNKSIAD